MHDLRLNGESRDLHIEPSRFRTKASAGRAPLKRTVTGALLFLHRGHAKGLHMHRAIATSTTTSPAPDWSRRRLLQAASAAAFGAAAATPSRHALAQGSDKPEKEEVRIGFIPLTDCASVVMASVLGFDRKYGVKIIPTK